MYKGKPLIEEIIDSGKGIVCYYIYICVMCVCVCGANGNDCVRRTLFSVHRTAELVIFVKPFFNTAHRTVCVIYYVSFVETTERPELARRTDELRMGRGGGETESRGGEARKRLKILRVSLGVGGRRNTKSQTK